MKTRRIVLGATALAAVLALGVSSWAGAAAQPISGAIVRNADGSYTLTVTSKASGLTDVNLIVPSGGTYAIKQGPHCKLASPTTIDCTPVSVPVNKSFAVVTFTASPAIPASGAFFLTLEGASSSYEIKLAVSPGGGSGTTTTTGKTSDRYDLQIEITPPATFDISKSPQRIEIHFTVANNGPAASPELDKSGALVKLSVGRVGGANHPLQVVAMSPGCGKAGLGSASVACSVRALAPHRSESFSFSARWTIKDKRLVAQLLAQGTKVDAFPVEGYVFAPRKCGEVETNCANNSATEEIAVKQG